MRIFNKGKRKFEVKDGKDTVVIQPQRFSTVSDELGKSLLKDYFRDLSETEDVNKDENISLKKEIAELKAQLAKKESGKSNKKKPVAPKEVKETESN